MTNQVPTPPRWQLAGPVVAGHPTGLPDWVRAEYDAAMALVERGERVHLEIPYTDPVSGRRTRLIVTDWETADHLLAAVGITLPPEGPEEGAA